MSTPRLPNAPRSETVVDVRTKIDPDLHARICVEAGRVGISVAMMMRRLLILGLEARESVSR